MSPAGIRTVAKQEFRVRLRTGRWRWLLVSWVVIIGAFTGLLWLGLRNVPADGFRGVPMFGGLMLFVLGLAMLVAPALTAQSINGDRERGTLATVQVTRLSAGEIVIGKLLAAWGTGLVFLVLTLPFVVWAVIEGGVGFGRAAFVVVTVGVLIGVICAMAQALSALFARGITATLMSYLLVFTLSIGTLIAFGLGVATTTTEETVRVPEGVRDTAPSQTYTTSRPHPQNVWWLLAPNPFVILADSAPEPPWQPDPYTGELQPMVSLDPLSAIGFSVRMARIPDNTGVSDFQGVRNSAPVWPYGLGFNLLLGAGSVWISVRGLRTPVRGLTRGVRIA